MKKTALCLLLSMTMAPGLYSQEFFADSLENNGFTGIYKSGDMGQFLNVPYFTTSKKSNKNFTVRRLNGENMMDEGGFGLELPKSFKLKSLSFNSMAYLLVFFDASKKEDVFISVVDENVVKKKTTKNTGNHYYPVDVMGEGFVLAVVDKKGNYYLEGLDKELESTWKKSFDAPRGVQYDIISIKNTMFGLQILRKENYNDGKYIFNRHTVGPYDGADIGMLTINNDSVKAYPTFFVENEGIELSAGYYHRNGEYAKKPDGIYLAILQPDGLVQQISTVPYSQVVEELKATLGNKLMDENSTIIFNCAQVSHEAQSYFVSGQLINGKLTEKGATVAMEDFVTMEFGFEGEYKGATAVKHSGQAVKVEGDLSKVNIVDFGVWLNNANLLQLKSYAFLPGSKPVLAYAGKSSDGNFDEICYKNAFPKSDTVLPICAQLTLHKIKERTYSFTGITAPEYPVLEYSLLRHHNPAAVIAYELHDNTLQISNKETPDLESIRIMQEPDQPEEEEPQPEDGEMEN